MAGGAMTTGVLAKRFNPAQPRHPKNTPVGGRWSGGRSGAGAAVLPVAKLPGAAMRAAMAESAATSGMGLSPAAARRAAVASGGAHGGHDHVVMPPGQYRRALQVAERQGGLMWAGTTFPPRADGRLAPLPVGADGNARFRGNVIVWGAAREMTALVAVKPAHVTRWMNGTPFDERGEKMTHAALGTRGTRLDIDLDAKGAVLNASVSSTPPAWTKPAVASLTSPRAPRLDAQTASAAHRAGMRAQQDAFARVAPRRAARVAEAIESYQESSSPINDALRGFRTRRDDAVSDAARARGPVYARTLLAAFEKHPRSTTLRLPTSVFRGVRGGLARQVAAARPGTVIHDRAFTSWTLRKDTAVEFALDLDGKAQDRLVTLRLARGARVRALFARRQDESELILDAAIGFRVVRSRTRGGFTTVTVEPVDLSASP